MHRTTQAQSFTVHTHETSVGFKTRKQAFDYVTDYAIACNAAGIKAAWIIRQDLKTVSQYNWK